MGSKTNIGWTDSTWNPVWGCTKVSAACKYCYAERVSQNMRRDFSKVERTNEKNFSLPRRWSNPRNIFVCSMSDFFHEGVDRWREDMWRTIYEANQHTYQILTKRPERIPDCLPSFGKKEWPWPHVHFGVTVENEDNLWRVEKLMEIPVALRFLSIEPMLGNIDVGQWILLGNIERTAEMLVGRPHKYGCIHWVIVGGESGPMARPMHPDWVRSIRDQCEKNNVPFFFKQWGEWVPKSQGFKVGQNPRWGTITKDGTFFELTTPWNGHDDDGSGEAVMVRVGTKEAGCILDGRVWSEMPIVNKKRKEKNNET